MSAICGFINKTYGKPADEDMKHMAEAYDKYRIDRADTISSENSFFYCGHQYITPEAHMEVLPYEDEDILFTADAILDNRQELIAELKVVEPVTDGRLIYLAYKKWGEESVNRLLGVFAYAIYDKKRDIFLLYTDHTGSRCIHYCITDTRILFSTLAEPIRRLLDIKERKINEKWISFCESIINPDMYFYTGDSAFEGIWHLEPGHYIRIEKGCCRKLCYWNPIADKGRLEKKSDKEYKSLFLDTFGSCVEDVMRSSGEYAITLSSGLDSSAVACMAAPMLKKRDKQLFSYTSVPLPDYKAAGKGYLMEDESHGPKEIAAGYTNVVPEYVSCEEESLFGQIPDMVELLEVPCKSFANLLWMNNIYAKAATKNCRIILKGQYGNSTISYGAILSLVLQKLQMGHPVSAYRELKSFMHHRRVGKRQVLHAIRSELAGRYIGRKKILENTYLKRKLVKKYRIDAVLQHNIRKGGGSLMDSVGQHRLFVYSLDILQHLGLFDTKLGLIHGIVVRDPTKDKRMLELCLKLPPECFVHNGIERRMVREYMEGIVPEAIRKDVNHRGLQSADIVFRANKEWKSYKGMLCGYLSNPQIKEYLDSDCLNRLIRELEEAEELKDKNMVQTVIALVSFSVFLSKFSDL